MPTRLPTIHIENRQRRVKFALGWLRQISVEALVRCLAHSADGRFALRALPEVEVAIVSDRTIARVHRDFMDIPGATDVITFEHGELVISADTAVENASIYGHRTEVELALYVIHGLLHLNGFEDASPADAALMHQLQDRILLQCLQKFPISA